MLPLNLINHCDNKINNVFPFLKEAQIIVIIIIIKCAISDGEKVIASSKLQENCIQCEYYMYNIVNVYTSHYTTGSFT